MKHKDTWHKLYAELRKTGEKHVGELPEVERERLLAQLKAEVSEAVRRFGVSAQRHSALDAKAGNVVDLNLQKRTRRKAVEGCHLLGIPPPRRLGLPIDPALLKRKKMAAVRATHPDITGSDTSRDAYEAVIAAADAIEAYNETCVVEGAAQHPEAITPPVNPAAEGI